MPWLRLNQPEKEGLFLICLPKGTLLEEVNERTKPPAGPRARNRQSELLTPSTWNVHSAQPVLTAGAGPRIQPSESNVLLYMWTGYVTEPS